MRKRIVNGIVGVASRAGLTRIERIGAGRFFEEAVQKGQIFVVFPLFVREAGYLLP